MDVALDPAASAFDAIASSFDERFGSWRSVAAQRSAVRACLLRAFPVGARILEIGGGTGEDALWLAQQGREVMMTDASPAMVDVAQRKLAGSGASTPRVAAAQSLDQLADELLAEQCAPFDGAFSNFAALNCVSDLRGTASGLARLVRPGGRAVLVVFGTLCVGEVVVQLLRREPRAAFRRHSRDDVTARLSGREFTVRYHRREDIQRAMHPLFRLTSSRGIGVFVPPSAAEPWISARPSLLRGLEIADRFVSGALAPLGDHVLHEFVRTELSVEEGL